MNPGQDRQPRGHVRDCTRDLQARQEHSRGRGIRCIVSVLDVTLTVMDIERFDAHLQRLLNAHPVPRRYVNAPRPGPIPVRARLVWEVDGEEWADGRAMAWTSRLIPVHANYRVIRVTSVDQPPSTLGIWIGSLYEPPALTS